jgi:hypothetical protein
VKHGLRPDELVPCAIVEIEGSLHRTYKQKVLVDKGDVQRDD